MKQLKEIKEVIPRRLDLDLLQGLSYSLNNYQDIMLQLDEGKISIASNEALQKQFANFYRFGAGRQGASFRQGYFEVMESLARKDQVGNLQELTLGLILERLKPCSNSIQRSFASKMLHSLRENEPIWDRMVLRNLGRSSDISGRTYEEKISKGNELYEQLRERYATFLTSEGPLYSSLYSQISAHPECAEALAKRPIKSTKIVDFILFLHRP